MSKQRKVDKIMTTTNTNEDKLILGGHEFTSRFIMGSGKFSLELMKACIEKAGAQIVTLALRRANEYTCHHQSLC
jgi:thiazole synthase